MKNNRRNGRSFGKGPTPRRKATVPVPGPGEVRATAFPSRIGFGNDVHRLVEGRKLILGGIEIPSGKGPLAHSDGDALAHAVCDALLGAAALGDIGRHFPDSSPCWRHASSLRFLDNVRKRLDRAGFSIVNLDATISLERPKLAPYIDRIRTAVASALSIGVGQVSVKAKTGEGLGEIGCGDAVRAEAVALLAKQGIS